MKVYQASTKHLYSEIDSEAVILDVDSGTYFGLNEVSNQLWQWMQNPASHGELLQLLLAEYDVTESEANTDLDSFLKEMLDSGLIEIVNEEAVQIS